MLQNATVQDKIVRDIVLSCPGHVTWWNLLPDHEAVDRQQESAEWGTWLGADVVGYWNSPL